MAAVVLPFSFNAGARIGNCISEKIIQIGMKSELKKKRDLFRGPY
jgi:hypothetical protein